MNYKNPVFKLYQGVGMTSQRTRNRLVERLVEKGVNDGPVLDAMRAVPRHLFIDEAMASRSYEDTALPIGFGQTISQPWVVAKMTQWLLETHQPIKIVLEIGTGSGYQTAILSILVEKVYSVERIQPLSERAQLTLNKLELDNVDFALSDGHWGWAEKAPFDAIISAASPSELPLELIKQLKMGGRLVMPIGESKQLLYGFVKTPEGVTKTCLGEVMFVPMKQGVEN